MICTCIVYVLSRPCIDNTPTRDFLQHSSLLTLMYLYLRQSSSTSSFTAWKLHFSRPPNSQKRANIWRMWKLKSLPRRWWLSGDHKSPALFAETPPSQNSEIFGQIFAPVYDQPLLWIALFSTTQDYQFPAKRPHSIYGDVSNLMNSYKNFLKKLFILSKWKTVIVQPGSEEVLIKDRTN